ncbi:MAG: hypothetical protein ACXWFB_12045 [Nitrososphaeraceae archaeon]
MAYSIRFFHFFNNGSLTSCWDNFSYFNIGACKEGYTPKEARIIRIRRIIQNLRYYIMKYFIKIISTDEIKVDNDDSM